MTGIKVIWQDSELGRKTGPPDPQASALPTGLAGQLGPDTRVKFAGPPGGVGPAWKQNAKGGSAKPCSLGPEKPWR